MTRLVDDPVRTRIRTSFDETLIVEAAAGTGKTTELIRRMIGLLAEGRTAVEHVVAVTFTEKAAGELKLRLRAGLEEARTSAKKGDVRRNLEHALSRLEEARVGTIHGFCADLLRERSVEADVDPSFTIMTEPEAESLFAEAFRLWLQQQLEKPPEGVRRSLRRSTHFDEEEGPIGRLRAAGWTLATWRDFPARWQRPAIDRTAMIDACVAELHAFAALTARSSMGLKDFLFKDTEPARAASERLARHEAVQGRDYDGAEAELVELLTYRFRNIRKGRGKTYGEGLTRDEVHAAHAHLVASLETFVTAIDADLAALLQRELLGAVERYGALKERRGKLDFVDLLVRARNLVVDSEEVRRDFQERFTHLFVDEFQDTDPLQAEILLLLASEDPRVDDWRRVSPAPGKLFLVGDPKQSIYRFRRADIGTYLDVKEHLVARGATCLPLTASFRSTPAIQRAVNRAFTPLMTGDRESLQPDYVPLDAVRDDMEAQPAVVALPVPEPHGYYGRVTKSAIEQSLPDAVGAFVAWLIEESGWTLPDPDDPATRRPIAARDVCILFRRFDSYFAGDVTRAYTQALEARDIRHLLVGGRSFHDREEVGTLRTALAAIEWPDDELSLFATLKGALFGINDDELLEYRIRFKRLHPFRMPDKLPEHLTCVRDALEVLRELHETRNERPVSETISVLLEATRAPAAFALRPSGEQVLANVLHVAEQARRYEGLGGISFRGFVERLMSESERGRSAEAPILEDGSDGVRLMTVHKAKGLEFPVVILADMTANLAYRNASRFIDAQKALCAVRIGGWSPHDLIQNQDIELKREAAESVRLTYVAATRARDLLVVPALGEGPGPMGLLTTGFTDAGWLAPLTTALYPEPAAWGTPAPGPGCPSFGKETVIVRDPESRSVSVRPGAHVIGGDTTVVWWDPSALTLGKRPPFGVRHDDLLSKKADSGVVEAGTKAFREWQRSRDGAIESGAHRALTVRTATDYAETEEVSGSGAVRVVAAAAVTERPSGRRFGALVHAVLANVPLDATPATIEPVAALHARILGADDGERDGCVRVVAAVLAHPLFERARAAQAAGRCRRETPVTMRLEEGELIDGVVDVAFEEEGRWTVVDVKTDVDIEGRLPAYQRQVALYAEAVSRATGQPAEAVLFTV